MSILDPLKFDMCDIFTTNYNKEYVKLFNANKELSFTKCYKRLLVEFASIKDCIPINYDASIFIRTDTNMPNIIRALITGPKDTPYDSGCFLFDIYVPNTYPQTHPYCWFLNSGGKREKFACHY
jgi:hypothetical protein